MVEVATSTNGAGLKLDVCRACYFVWFDPVEFEQLPQLPQPAPEPELPEKAREALAIAKAQAIAQQAQPMQGEAAPDEFWKYLPAIFGMPVELQTWVVLYLEFFFVPQGLFAYFIAGFLAPRASYLVGGLLGVLSGALYAIAELATAALGTNIPMADAATGIVYSAFVGMILGTFAGGFAAWYRNFLRQMQDNGRRRRADKEAQERAKRRAERQESRRVVKQRPTS